MKAMSKKNCYEAETTQAMRINYSYQLVRNGSFERGKLFTAPCVSFLRLYCYYYCETRIAEVKKNESTSSQQKPSLTRSDKNMVNREDI